MSSASSTPAAVSEEVKVDVQAEIAKKNGADPVIIAAVEQYIDATDTELIELKDQIKYEDAAALTVERFRSEYEGPDVPVMLRGVAELGEWTAPKNWELTETNPYWSEKTSILGKIPFRVAGNGMGGKDQMTLPEYCRYMAKQATVGSHQHTSPRYLFDPLHQSSKVKFIGADYKRPVYFQNSLFEYYGPDRPSYRWLLIGPRRSGTIIHIDPWGTSAWNTSIRGRKRWLLFPPGTPEALIYGLDMQEEGEEEYKSMEACIWFSTILPKLKAREAALPAQGPEVPKHLSRDRLGMLEFIQEPGQTVFIPGGWWHAVLNLTDTIAITENYANESNFERVWKRVRENKRYAYDFLDGLEDNGREDLVERANALLVRDNFTLPERWCPIEGLFAASDEETSSSEDEVYSEDEELSKQVTVVAKA